MPTLVGNFEYLMDHINGMPKLVQYFHAKNSPIVDHTHHINVYPFVFSVKSQRPLPLKANLDSQVQLVHHFSVFARDVHARS